MTAAENVAQLKSAPAHIAEAICSIMGEIGAVAKAGKNQHFGYKFVEAADIAAAVQPLMAKHGLAILQDERSYNYIHDGALLAVSYIFRLLHRSGAVWEYPTSMTGMCRGKDRAGWDDKALNKCHTAARKYFLISLFNISTSVDDADRDDTFASRGRETAGSGADTKQEVKRDEVGSVARPAPPVHPETGEVSPHRIPMLMKQQANGADKQDWIGWGAKFAAAIDSAKDEKEIDAWLEENKHDLAGAEAKAPKIAARLNARIADAKAAFTLPAPYERMLEGLKDQLFKAPAGTWNTLYDAWAADEHVKFLLSSSKPFANRAAAIYESVVPAAA